jgi:hypothetical protein
MVADTHPMIEKYPLSRVTEAYGQIHSGKCASALSSPWTDKPLGRQRTRTGENQNMTTPAKQKSPAKPASSPARLVESEISLYLQRGSQHHFIGGTTKSY